LRQGQRIVDGPIETASIDRLIVDLESVASGA
jgi:hypothetical protein